MNRAKHLNAACLLSTTIAKTTRTFRNLIARHRATRSNRNTSSKRSLTTRSNHLQRFSLIEMVDDVYNWPSTDSNVIGWCSGCESVDWRQVQDGLDGHTKDATTQAMELRSKKGNKLPAL
jgi:hypothetical protein